ncbi:MAG: DNA-directed RNA polymerase subunit beta', partial [Verrucomicrobiota bacterium]
IFGPSDGKPITKATQDITLGCSYMTQNPRSHQEDQRIPMMGSADEVVFAYDEKVISIHDLVYLKNPDYGKETIFGNKDEKLIKTTAGRVIFNEIWPNEIGYYNKPAGDKQLGEIVHRCYQICGHDRTIQVLDDLKRLGFRFATKAGISMGVDDMIIPDEKEGIVKNARDQVNTVEKQYRMGAITDGERYNKIVDIWTQATDEVSNVMFGTLRQNKGRSEFNPVYLMVDSGARGNRNQVRQLAGMRGLMAKPSGEIIERPILASFREGLSVLEYFISSHGARKGLADTALKTADSGYMTRKLVDVAHDVIVTEDDCGTVKGIWMKAVYEGEDEIVSLPARIMGRVSCDDIVDPVSGNVVVAANEVVDEEKALAIEALGQERVRVRSVLTCETKRGICGKCYGVNLANNRYVQLGESVGIIAAQSIGEPGTQLTMRTFHIGGTATSGFKQPQIKARNSGIVKYNELRVVKSLEGNNIVLNKNGQVSIHAEDGRELEKYNVVIGSTISVPEDGTVKKGEVFVEWDPYNVSILTEKPGKIEFRDIIEGVTMKREIDEATKQVETIIIDHKEDLHPQIVIMNDQGEPQAAYSIPSGAHIEVAEGKVVEAGERLAKTPRKVSKTKDITGGLPRVAELFEARRPKDAAEIAKIDGEITIGGTSRGKRLLIIKDKETGLEEEHQIPLSKHLIVYQGDTVKKGQKLTDGPVVPHEILEVCGPQELQEYLVNEIQEVYRLQGVEINDKHIETIVRQMLRKVKITEPGDTQFLWGEQIDRLTFEEENRSVAGKGGKPAEASPVLLGITKSSLETESFISAASFQDTTRVLTDAATLGKVDQLRGFKENVIMGHLIPAGTGFPLYKNIRLVQKGEPVGDPLVGQEEEGQENTGGPSAEKKVALEIPEALAN